MDQDENKIKEQNEYIKMLFTEISSDLQIYFKPIHQQNEKLNK